MSTPVNEAQEFLNANKDLLEEMIRYNQNKPPGSEDKFEGDEMILHQYNKLKTYILEKKMGLLSNN